MDSSQINCSVLCPAPRGSREIRNADRNLGVFGGTAASAAYVLQNSGFIVKFMAWSATTAGTVSAMGKMAEFGTRWSIGSLNWACHL